MQSYNERVRGDGKSRSVPKHFVGSSSMGQSLFDVTQKIANCQSLEDSTEFDMVLFGCDLRCWH